MFDNLFHSISELTKIDFFSFAKRIEVSVQSFDLMHNPLIIIDILISAILLYFFLVFLKKIRIRNLLLGAIVLIILYVLAYYLDLALLLFIIKYFALFLVVVVPFFLTRGMRRALDRIEKEIKGVQLRDMSRRDREGVIEEIARVVALLAKKRIGSLIILENKDSLNGFIQTGEKIEAKATAEFLTYIFFPGSSLRQGGTIIRGDEVIAVKCILPKTKRGLYLDHVSPRDLAAVGVSEATDALCFVTSKSRGDISVAHEGSYINNLEPERIPYIIETLLAGKEIKKKIDIE
jgi:diadenylate cyclase